MRVSTCCQFSTERRDHCVAVFRVVLGWTVPCVSIQLTLSQLFNVAEAEHGHNQPHSRNTMNAPAIRQEAKKPRTAAVNIGCGLARESVRMGLILRWFGLCGSCVCLVCVRLLPVFSNRSKTPGGAGTHTSRRRPERPTRQTILNAASSRMAACSVSRMGSCKVCVF